MKAFHSWARPHLLLHLPMCHLPTQQTCPGKAVIKDTFTLQTSLPQGSTVVTGVPCPTRGQPPNTSQPSPAASHESQRVPKCLQLLVGRPACYPLLLTPARPWTHLQCVELHCCSPATPTGAPPAVSWPSSWSS